MEKPVKILIVEDEMIIGANISLQLTKLGYEVTAILPRGEDALSHIKETLPDIILLDIQLKGEIDGIETAKRIKAIRDVPIIFLTANADDAHFNLAKEIKPHDFISKPFKKLDLQRAIEMTIERIKIDKQQDATDNSNQKITGSTKVVMDGIFFRYNDRMIKILIDDILFIEADRNYSTVNTKDKNYLLVLTLKSLEEKLPPSIFLRVHRSYIVNLTKVDEVDNNRLFIGKKYIPISKTHKTTLYERLQLI